MSDEHLHPNRGWALIRSGEDFSSTETEHLQNCDQCSEWLALFAEMARHAGFKPLFDPPYYVVADQHLTAGRAWNLIRDHGQLTTPEIGHLHYCQTCHDWLTSFAARARSAGFTITFEIPVCDNPIR
jgi:predicted anti-sigma-YlaC factor YlaD